MASVDDQRWALAQYAPKVASSVALVGLLTLGLVPTIRQVVIGLTALFSSGGPAFGAGRVATLLARSVAIGLGATVIAIIIGSVIGVLLARVMTRWTSIAVVGLFVVFCVSPYVLALGWLGARLDGPIAGSLLGRPVVVSWILGTAFAPLVSLVVYALTRARAATAEDAAFLMGAPWRALVRVSLPRITPDVAVVGVLVFAFSVSDYAVASLLQVPTYPVEVFIYYAGVFQPEIAARACIPLVALGFITAVVGADVMQRVWPSRNELRRSRRWAVGRPAEIVAWLSVLSLSIVIGFPVGRLLVAWPGNDAALRAIQGGAEAALNSIGLSMGAVVLMLLFAWPSSVILGSLRGVRRRLLMIGLLLPLFLPPTAFAIAWVETCASLGLSSAQLGISSSLMCLAARFGGVLAVFLAALRSGLAQEPLEASCLQCESSLRRWFRVEAPLLAPGAFAAAVILGAMALNATGILVMTAPPGFEVLPLRVDNLLHYGLPEEAAVLAVATATLATVPILLAVAAAGFLNRRGRRC